MLTAEEIIAEAPVSESYGCKLAFCCTACPWWAHSWSLPEKDPKGRLLCSRCKSFLRVLPLEALVQSTREQNPQNFEAFIKSNAANTGVPAQGGETR